MRACANMAMATPTKAPDIRNTSVRMVVSLEGSPSRTRCDPVEDAATAGMDSTAEGTAGP
jgi:hypothetical protein